MSRARLAVICDYAEEGWPSMDLVGEMLCAELAARHADALEATRVRPAFVRRLSRPPVATAAAPARLAGARFNADRVLNRFFDYPRALRRLRGRFDLFHIVDHSYAHLALALDGGRTLVTCHDLDAFRCLLVSGAARRSLALRTMARRTLAGMRRAARICCDSAATRDALIAHRLASPERAVVIPNGVHPACTPRPDEAADSEIARRLGPGRPDAIDVLHVGATIARKRIDVLLRVIAAARREFPGLRLLKAGGALNAEQMRLAGSLGLAGSIVTMPFLEPPLLAALYRRAAMVLMPSEYEGFGLPLAEAMACGTPVIASDIPALREVGAAAAAYCAVEDVPAWTAALAGMLRERAVDPARWAERSALGVRRAAQFSWAAHADRCAALYRELAG